MAGRLNTKLDVLDRRAISFHRRAKRFQFARSRAPDETPDYLSESFFTLFFFFDRLNQISRSTYGST